MSPFAEDDLAASDFIAHGRLKLADEPRNLDFGIDIADR